MRCQMTTFHQIFCKFVQFFRYFYILITSSRGNPSRSATLSSWGNRNALKNELFVFCNGPEKNRVGRSAKNKFGSKMCVFCMF